MIDRIRTGMKVLSLDGQALGHVEEVSGETLLVVSGHGRLDVPVEEIGSVLAAEVFLKLPLRRYLPRYTATA